jgi:hypothetical protein
VLLCDQNHEGDCCWPDGEAVPKFESPDENVGNAVEEAQLDASVEENPPTDSVGPEAAEETRSDEAAAGSADQDRNSAGMGD